jgi:hypothetical protein
LLENNAKITYNDSPRGYNSVVECLLPKQKVVGSNPITRSRFGSFCLFHTIRFIS